MTLNSGGQEWGNPGTQEPPGNDFDDIRREAEERASQEKEEYQETPILDAEKHRAGRLISGPQLPIEWLLVYSLMVKVVGFIVGAAGAGKSQYVLQMLAAIASKTASLVGFEPGTHGRVVYLAAEEDERILQKRLKNITREFITTDEQQGAIENNLFVIPGAGHDWRFIQNENGNAQPSEFYLKLLDDLKSFGPIALLVIDPMARFYGQNENDNSSATMFVSLMERLKEELQTTVLCVHHIGKSDPVIDDKSLEKALHQDSARGASALTGAARWQLNIVPLPPVLAKKIGFNDASRGKFLAARVSKNNYASAGNTFYMERINDGLLVPVEPCPFEVDLINLIQQKIMAVLVEKEVIGQKITKRGVCDVYTSQWKSEDKRISKNIVGAAIEDGIIKGIFEPYDGKNRAGKIVEYLKRKTADPGEL